MNTQCLKLADFDYDLPEVLIAKAPLQERTQARMFCVNRKNGSFEHKKFCDITEYLQKGDCLVLNDTRVIPARLWGRKVSGGKVEALLHRSLDAENRTWEVLLKPAARVRAGSVLYFAKEQHTVEAEVLEPEENKPGFRVLRFTRPLEETFLREIGHMPLPPYIDREDEPRDWQDYQTVFSRAPGAVASPTAGLHFDEPLLAALQEKGVQILYITLHVGYGTFRPVIAENIQEHQMHAERYEISAPAAAALNKALAEGQRIIACGTTTARTLEGAYDREKGFYSCRQETDIFMYPSYEFKVISGLITNFHLPRTTLLMLVSAFAGLELTRRAYQTAIEKEYRFYSYGDGMLIL